MSEDPFERHEDEIKKSLIISLFARENLKSYKPSLDIVRADAKDLYGSAKELQEVRGIPWNYNEIERITEQLVKEELVGFEFVHPPAHLDHIPMPVKVYWLRGFAPSELKPLYLDPYFGRKVLENPPAKTA